MFYGRTTVELSAHARRARRLSLQPEQISPDERHFTLSPERTADRPFIAQRARCGTVTEVQSLVPMSEWQRARRPLEHVAPVAERGLSRVNIREAATCLVMSKLVSRRYTVGPAKSPPPRIDARSAG